MTQYSLQELLAICIISPLLIASIIALLNLDSVNNIILQFTSWLENKHNTVKSDVFKFIFSIFSYPSKASKAVTHMGWRSGLSVVSISFSSTLLVGLLAIAGVILYYLVIIALAILGLSILLGLFSSK